MKAFLAFFKKELLESARSGKLMLLGCLFFAFGIMNPAIAKLTPWLLEMLSDQLAESGMTITEVTVDAMTSWTQFFKNIPMALIAFILVYGGSFTKEYESETLILILTKGIARRKIVLAKALLMLSLWSVGYWSCFAVTYGYNAYFWDNGIARSLFPATAYWWLFGVFSVCLTVLFSVCTANYAGVLLGTGGCILTSYLIGFIPKLQPYTPTSLMNGMALLNGAATIGDYDTATIVTASLCTVSIALSIPIFNKKQL